jgi:hypothetical protein
MIRQFRPKLVLTRYPDLVFWVCFSALNLLLFLPWYLLNRKSTTLLPLPASLASAPLDVIKELALRRENLDPFRLNAEITLLVALWVLVGRMKRPRQRRIFHWFFLAVYLGTLGYYVYEGVMVSLYQVQPVFYSHYRLLVDGIPFVIRNLQVPPGFYVLATLTLAAGIILIGTLIRTMFNGVVTERLSHGSGIGLAIITLLVLAFAFKYQELLASPQMALSSLVYKLHENIHASIQVRRNVHAFDDRAPQTTYDYSGYDLLEKPNIYLIFVESYGSVLYKRTDYRQAYTSLLSQLGRQLEEDGWYVTSALSEAPTWGGGSWMSYTSALFGFRIDNHPEYLSLIDRYQSTTYPDLGHYLKSQGYEYARLSPLSDQLEEKEWLKYKNFYGVDRWLRYTDLGYQGVLYGWGPAPPDQYTLYFAHEAIVKVSDRPVFLFTITQNSHYPWVPLPKVTDDWRTLNLSADQETPPPPELIPHEVRRKNYLNSIEYELEFLTDFILRIGDDESVFVLIGDHQPQRVSRRSDGFDTPIHIISKDAAFVDDFSSYGFVRGLTVQDPIPTMKHESFYSMFVRALLAQYGRDVKVLPTYLPDGVTHETSVSAEQF